MVESVASVHKKKSISYRDQLSALKSLAEQRYSSMSDVVLKTHLDKFYSALSGTYETVKYVNEHRNKIVRGRTYAKRLEFASEEMRNIEALLKESRAAGTVSEEQIGDISNYMRSLYQVAIRDNKYVQKHLETGGFRNSKNYVMPSLVEYYTANSARSSAIREKSHELGQKINSLEALIGVNGKKIRESKPRQDSMYRASMSAGVARVPADQAIRPEPEKPAISIRQHPMQSPLQQSYANIINSALTRMTNLGNNERNEVIYYKPMRPNEAAQGPMVPHSSRNWRTSMVQRFSPFHRKRKSTEKIYDQTPQVPTLRGWGTRAIKHSLQMAAGIAVAAGLSTLFSPIGSTSARDVRAEAFNRFTAPMKTMQSEAYDVNLLQKEQAVRIDIAGDNGSSDIVPTHQDVNLKSQLYELIERNRSPVDLPTESHHWRYHDGLTPSTSGEATTKFEPIRGRLRKLSV